ncbi:MAG: DUF3332 domain-containing protein [Prevotellaceae bacterium]|jgi:hypothetical protein|nr:DUF3332 domain-containing protein [Prevotellaceae bacterium]
MKSKFFAVAIALTMAGSVTLTSCLGSFALTNKVYDFNKRATENRFINNVIFWAFNIVPVYSVSLFVDGVVLNLIEFWTKSNPLAVGESQTISSENGNYVVTATENGYQITNEEGQELSLVNENDTWSYSVSAAQ